MKLDKEKIIDFRLQDVIIKNKSVIVTSKKKLYGLFKCSEWYIPQSVTTTIFKLWINIGVKTCYMGYVLMTDQIFSLGVGKEPLGAKH